jgi:hypothetical protein
MRWGGKLSILGRGAANRQREDRGEVRVFSEEEEPLRGFANGRSLGGVLRLIAAGMVGVGARYARSSVVGALSV